MWYCLMPLVVYGALYTVRNYAIEAYIIVAYVAVLTLAYTFGITNMGALYRFRAQMLVFYLIFAAVGIAKWKGTIPLTSGTSSDINSERSNLHYSDNLLKMKG